MEKKEMEQLSDEALIEEHQNYQKYKTYDAVIVGFLLGVAVYSIVKSGFGLLTFLPLVYVPIAGKNNKKRAELLKEVERRGLNT